ncbi:LADA_0H04830g1_1 [Lachancea dasiensis]|uniref:Enolase-phosphatase E1 n=1 Tax=Lachancea dasiensis TaxID=1072105 RepID=A0A1G4K0W1_9SACH|nr:LADA_0H04830g1_1 [Lachancea dasiensis]
MPLSAVLLDIEGTICPIVFVKEVLFPYFLQQVETLLKSEDPKVQKLLRDFGVDDVESHIRRLVSHDIKDPILKQLQGLVWNDGYAGGQLAAPVYADAIKYIQTTDRSVYIYSSGSVQAQKLLLQYVSAADKSIDLRPHIKDYYDIKTTGIKTDPASYSKIIQEIGCKPEEVLFISDNTSELDAAQECGMQTKLAIRPGNYPVDNASDYDTITDFGELSQ